MKGEKDDKILGFQITFRHSLTLCVRNIIAECRAAAFMRFFERADLPGSAVQCLCSGGAAAIALLHYVIVQTLNGRVRVAR